ncbi:MAG: extracellular solute-binding protein, partial [Cyanobacteria bacterium J06650_10]
SLVIVYRQRTDHPAFETWADLLDPALKGKIALPDHPNVVLGLLQKMQTGSFNSRFDSLANNSQADSNTSTTQLTSKLTNKLTEQLSTQLAAPFAELNQQVRTYDSRTALKALVNEDLQAIVTWSGDVVTALQRYRSLRAIVPDEGSLLSADMWVRPKGASLNEAARAWIDFCWQTGPATQLSVSGAGISPTFLTEQALPETIAGGYLSRVAMQNSEPLLPLPEAMQAAYFALWQQLRSQAA